MINGPDKFTLQRFQSDVSTILICIVARSHYLGQGPVPRKDPSNPHVKSKTHINPQKKNVSPRNRKRKPALICLVSNSHSGPADHKNVFVFFPLAFVAVHHDGHTGSLCCIRKLVHGVRPWIYRAGWILNSSCLQNLNIWMSSKLPVCSYNKYTVASTPPLKMRNSVMPQASVLADSQNCSQSMSPFLQTTKTLQWLNLVLFGQIERISSRCISRPPLYNIRHFGGYQPPKKQFSITSVTK